MSKLENKRVTERGKGTYTFFTLPLLRPLFVGELAELEGGEGEEREGEKGVEGGKGVAEAEAA